MTKAEGLVALSKWAGVVLRGRRSVGNLSGRPLNPLGGSSISSKYASPIPRVRVCMRVLDSSRLYRGEACGELD